MIKDISDFLDEHLVCIFETEGLIKGLKRCI